MEWVVHAIKVFVVMTQRVNLSLGMTGDNVWGSMYPGANEVITHRATNSPLVVGNTANMF